jgi:hypothetical protein
LPTLIDSLIVSLSLDSKDVDAKAPGVRQKLKDLEKSGDSASKGIGGVSKAAKGTGEELTSLAGKMAAFLALIGGTVALRQFTMEAIKTNTQLNYLSKNLNIPVQALSAWGIASTMVGGSAQEMQGYIAHLATESLNLSNGLGSSLIPILGKMGVAMIDSKGKARSALDELQDMAKWAQGKNREQVFAWFQQAGMPAGVANLLFENPRQFAAMLEQARKLSPTNQNVSSAAQMTMQLALLHAQFNKLGYELLETVTPILEKFFALLEGGLNWCLAHQTAVAAFMAALAAGIGAVSVAMGVLFLSTIEISGPILLVVAAIAALAAAFTGLTLDYSSWSHGGASLFDWSQFESNIRKAGDAFKWLGDQIEAATDRFENWLRSQGVNVPEGAVKKGLTWWWNHVTPQGILGMKVNGVTDEIRARGQKIANAEGFYAKGESPNIPQEAHNPGDIEYGKFAVDHGATGYKTAQGGKQIAVFPDEGTGWSAMYALLQSKSYAGLNDAQTLSKWQTGKVSGAANPSPVIGIPSASSTLRGPFPAAGSQVYSVDRSVTNHFGHIDIHTLATDAQSIWKDMSRNMDWLTVSPANSGSL